MKRVLCRRESRSVVHFPKQVLKCSSRVQPYYWDSGSICLPLTGTEDKSTRTNESRSSRIWVCQTPRAWANSCAAIPIWKTSMSSCSVSRAVQARGAPKIRARVGRIPKVSNNPFCRYNIRATCTVLLQKRHKGLLLFFLSFGWGRIQPAVWALWQSCDPYFGGLAFSSLFEESLHSNNCPIAAIHYVIF